MTFDEEPIKHFKAEFSQYFDENSKDEIKVAL